MGVMRRLVIVILMLRVVSSFCCDWWSGEFIGGGFFECVVGCDFSCFGCLVCGDEVNEVVVMF